MPRGRPAPGPGRRRSRTMRRSPTPARPRAARSLPAEGMPGETELADAEVAGAEAGLAVGEVELPHPPEGVVEGPLEPLPVVQELLPPDGEGLRVVRAEVAA